MDYNNWLVMRIIGLAMTVAGLSLMALTITNSDQGSVGGVAWFLRANFYSFTIIGLGALLIVLSMRKTMVLEVETEGTKAIFSLREIAKQGQIGDLAGFVQRQIPNRIKFQLII